MSDEAEYVPLTPLQIERAYRELKHAIAEALADLIAARHAEAEADKDYRTARVEATFGTPDGLTVDERKDWIEARVLNQRIAVIDAKTLRQSAQDTLDALKEQLSAVQSAGKSVNTAYQTYRGN